MEPGPQGNRRRRVEFSSVGRGREHAEAYTVMKDSSTGEGQAAAGNGTPNGAPPQGRGLAACDALRAAAYGAAALTVSLVLRLRTPGIPGYDSYYHFRHADLYVRHNLWMKAFPWLPYSTISEFSGDIGYGFHVFLMPFTLLPDEFVGIKLAAALETAIVLFLVWLVLRRHGLTYASAWPFYLLCFAPPITYTFVLTRPQTLTMGFAAVLLSFMVQGPAWGVALASFAIAFFHLNAFPLVLVIVAVAAVIKGTVESRWEWRKWLSALLGIGVGWLLRPNPLGVAKLEHNQILVHEAVRHAQLPLQFGREWAPVAVSALGPFAIPIFLWVAGSVFLLAATIDPRFRLEQRDRTLLWTSISLSALFFVLTVSVTRRFTPFWATSAVIAIAMAFTVALDRWVVEGPPRRDVAPRLWATVALLAVLGASAWGAFGPEAAHVRWTGPADNSLREVAAWLRDNGTPEEIVCNVDWGMFPELFFWNTEDRYVCGLDPIFLYAYDPQLYWKYHHVATGAAVEQTYDSPSWYGAAPEDLYTFVHEDLRASYLVFNCQRYVPLDAYLQSDERFSRVLTKGNLVVYAIRGSPKLESTSTPAAAAGQP